MADGSISVALSPVPFSRDVQSAEARAGETIKATLTHAVNRGALALHDLPRVNVYVDGARLDRATALDHVLAEGQIVNIVVEPLGGGGGGRKDVGQVLLSLAVIAVSAWVGGGAGGMLLFKSAMMQQVAAATVLSLGQAAVAALFQPETAAQAKVNERYALQSASNQYRPWQAFPLALGEVVVAPDMAVKTFTRAIGDEVWIYGILALHYGPCAVSELKIGETLVSSMGEGDFRMVEHLAPGPRTFSIYANDVDQLDLQEELQATTSAATPVVRAGSSEGERFEFDFYLPGGLNYTKDDGRLVSAAVTVTIRYRPIDAEGNPTGGGDWIAGATLPLNAASNEPWRITQDLTLALGRYQFEIVRSIRIDDNAKRHDDIAITAIRSIAFRKPIADETVSIIEFAARATALNQGTLAPITCRIAPLCETWTGTEWGEPVATSNPAALTRWLMTGPAPAKPLEPVQADQQLREWARLCDEYDWKAAFYLIDDRKQDAVLGLLEQAGRASLFWDGSQLVASPWVEKPIPRQLFADTNLKDHRWTIAYPEEVHALRVEFQNLDEGGDPDELYVYADGYAEVADEGVQAAVLVEALRVEGQKTAERAYRDGRWELGRRIHQRRIDTWTTDIEHVVCRYGDRVRLAWQRAADGASARVRCRHWSGDDVVGLRLTQAVEMVPGEDYALDMRLADGLYSGVPIQNPATTEAIVTRNILFANPRAEGLSPKAGDLVAFGVADRVSEDVEIIGIEPGADLTAVLTGIRYVAPLLIAGETGPIPPLQTRLTRQRSQDPPAPTLLGVQVEDTGVRVGFAMPPWAGSPVTGFDCRWRPKPTLGQTVGWTTLPSLGASAMTLTTPPMREAPNENSGSPDAEVTRVEIEIRALTASGRVSAPLLVTAVKPVAHRPLETEWTVTVRGPDEDGSQQPGLVVTRVAEGLLTPSVVIEYALQNGAPWTPAYNGPATLPRYDITGLAPATAYWVAITNISAQGVPSARRVYGPRTTGGLVSGDTTHWGGVPASVLPAVQQMLSDTVEQLLGLANDRAAGDIERSGGLLSEIRDNLDRLLLLANIDPIARTAIVRGDVMLEGEDETIAQTFVIVRAAAEAASAAVAVEQLARIAGDEAEASARITALAASASALAAADLSLRAYTNGQISSAVAGLVTSAALASAISASALSLQSYTDGQIATATAGLATAAALSSAIAAALIQSQLQVDAYAASAAITFAAQSSFNSLSSTVGIQGTALSGLTARDNTAHLELVASAGGGLPARIGLYSAGGSSNLALIAAQIFWGENTVFDDATDQLRTTYGSRRRVIALGAPFGPDSLWMWTGPAGVAYGSETFANATGGAESDGYSLWGGATLSGPFDSAGGAGAYPGSTITDLTTSWANLLWVEKAVRNGSFAFRLGIETSGSAAPDGEGVAYYEIEFQIVSVAWDYSEQETLWAFEGGGLAGGFTGGEGAADWTTYPGTRTGRRRLFLQARIKPGSATTAASVRNVRLRGFYAA